MSRAPGDPESTNELIVRMHGGDGAARSALLERLGPRVRGLAAVRMGRSLIDVYDLDDITQEVLITAIEGLADFASRSEGSLIRWLAAVVQSRIRDASRRARAEKRGGGEVRRRADLGVTTLADIAPASQRPSPSQAVAAAEFDPALERALLALPAAERELVYCRMVLDMGFAEIASELDIADADRARARFHKTVAKLRTRLSSPPAADGDR